MNLEELQLEEVAHFKQLNLRFGASPNSRLNVIYGPNEAGKSTLLHLLVDLLFGGNVHNKSWYTNRSGIQSRFLHQDKTYSLVRKKRYSQLVVDEHMSDLTEDQLQIWLNHVERERYLQLYGFDHERLRTGGESLLESRGDVGVSLFEAGSGLQHVMKTLESLEERVRDLLDTSFRSNSNKEINALIRSYKEASESTRANTLKESEWLHLNDTWKKARQQMGDLQRDRTELIGKQQRTKRILRGLPIFQDVRRLREEESSYGEIKILDLSVEERLETLLTDVRETARRVEQTRERQLLLTKRLQEIPVDEEILTCQSRIQHVYANLSRHTEIVDAKEREEIQLQEREQEIRRYLMEIDPSSSIEDVPDLLLPASDLDRLDDFVDAWQELQRGKQSDVEHEQRTRRDHDSALEELRQLGEPEESEWLQHTVEEAREARSLVDRLSDARIELEGTEAQAANLLMRQDIWQGSYADLLRRPIPLFETVLKYRDVWSKKATEYDQLVRIQKEYETDRDRLRNRLVKLENERVVPTTEDLHKARSERDTLWTSLRNWLTRGTVPSAEEEAPIREYEETTRLADDVADELFHEAAHVAERDELLRSLSDVNEKIQKSTEQMETWKTEFSSSKAKWESEWSTSGIIAKPPEEMRAWVQTVYQPICALAKGISQQGEAIQRFETRITQCRSELTEALAKLGEPVETKELSFRDVLRMAEQKLVSLEQRSTNRRELQRMLVDAEKRLSEVRSRLEAWGSKEALWGKSWSELCNRHPMLPAEPALAKRHGDRLRRLKTAYLEWSLSRERIHERGTQISAYEAEVAELYETLFGDNDSKRSVEEQVEELEARLEKVKRLNEERRILHKDEQAANDEYESFRQKHHVLESELEEYLTAFSLHEWQELSELMVQSREKRKVHENRLAREQDWINSGDGLSLKGLEAEMETVENRDHLEGELATIEDQLSTIDGQIGEVNQELGGLRHSLEALDSGKSDAADSMQTAQSYVTRIEDLWREFVQTDVAARLLRKSVEVVREENQDGILTRASEIFERITLGAFQGLNVDHDGERPLLTGIRENGSICGVEDMSDGTRDQLHLSLRLAFVDKNKMSENPLPIILDDILVHFDDVRASATLQVLDELAEHTQIIYFTHHKHIVERVIPSTRLHRVQVQSLATKEQVMLPI